MIQEKPKKKGHSVGLSAVIGIVLVTLLVGILLGGYLGLAVIGPFIQHIGGNSDDQGYTGDQNNQNNQNNNQNNNNNPTDNGNQGGNIINNIPSPSSPTNNYGGSGQFQVTMTQNGNTISGTVIADMSCLVEQSGNNIQLSLTITPTTVSDSLQQTVSTGNDVVLNFAGTTSGSQIDANSQGTMGGGNGGFNFDLNLRGTIDQSQLSFTITSASDSKIAITSHSITLYSK
jgi:hypothetical protein